MTQDGSDERAFLHDLASPIGAALFLADMILDGMQSRPGVDQDELQQVLKLHQSLERVKKCLAERREILIQRGVPSARS